MMVNSHAYYCSWWLYTIQELLVRILNSQWKLRFYPKIKHSISMKIRYAQLYMMVRSCINFHSCWVNRFLHLLLAKLNSHNLRFSDKKKLEIFMASRFLWQAIFTFNHNLAMSLIQFQISAIANRIIVRVNMDFCLLFI